MRKLMVLCLLIAGCGGSGGFFKDYEVGAEKQAMVGSVMVTSSNETKVANHAARITQQLIYGGVTARVVRIAYKEYGEELVKPMFFQDLQYDLNESEMIVFQDFAIQVLEATSKSIRFKVLAGPLDPSAPEGPKKEPAPPVFPM